MSKPEQPELGYTTSSNGQMSFEKTIPLNSISSEQVEAEQLYENGDDENRGEPTPLWVRGTKEHGYFVTIADRKITNAYPSMGEAKEAAMSGNINMWLKIITTMCEKVLQIQAEEAIKQINEAAKGEKKV